MLERTKKVTFRLTEYEYAEMCRRAHVAGLKIEPFIRSLIEGCEVKPRPPDSYKDLAREIAAVGNNINQITHLANSIGYVGKEQLDRIESCLGQIWDLVQERV